MKCERRPYEVSHQYSLGVSDGFLFLLVCLDCWGIQTKIVHRENIGF